MLAVSSDNIINVSIAEEEDKIDSTPRDSEDIDNTQTPYERMIQKLLDAVTAAYKLDPTGENRAVAVVVTLDNGKTWQLMSDSTEENKYGGQEIWSKAYVEAEVTKIKTAFMQKPQLDADL